jgi:hypothetical protein
MKSDPQSGTARSALASLRRFARSRASGRTWCELCSTPAAPKYRRVPRRFEFLTDFRMSDIQWEGLGFPINLAFFLHSTPAGRIVALYPSPEGASEALLPSDACQDVVDDYPCLRDLEPDVEALLVNRLGPEPMYCRVGVDQCYALVGIVRTHWRGLSGGAADWAEITRFFDRLREHNA